MGGRVTAVSLSVAFAAAALPAACAASTATLTGRLAGAALPARSSGVVPMAAFRVRDGALVAGAYARPDGRFSLRTPPGRYALLAAVVPFRGARRPLERVAAFSRAVGGRRTTVRATLKRRTKRRARRARSAAAHAAFVEVDYPAVAVLEFTAPAGPFAVMGRGVPEMLTTDLIAAVATTHCDAVFVERMRLNDVLHELELQSDPRFDPASRVPTGHLIANNATVTGSLTVAGDTLTISATHTNLRTGKRQTVSQTGPADDVFSLEQALVPKLVQLICPHTPAAYDATFNGTARTELNDYHVQWNGSARVERTTTGGQPPDRWPAGRYAEYALVRGSVHAVLDGTRSGASAGSCTVHGEADFALPATQLATVSVQLDEDTPALFVAINGRGDEAIPYTETGAGCGQTGAQYPLSGVIFASTPDPLTAPGAAAPLTANTSWDLFGVSHYSSQFTFTPAD